jgi:putative sterol carrier protein
MAAIKYLSPDWTTEANTRLREQLTAAEMKFLTSSMLTLYHHCPDGKDRALYFKIENGVFTEISVCEPPLPQAEFVISGDYATFAKITRAQLGSRVALLNGKLRLNGNMIKALMLTPIVDRFNKILSEIPCEY